jgi:hypothetical protein
MGNLLYLAMAVGLSTLGVCVLWLVRHRPRSMQSRIDAFSRELQALAPTEIRARRSEIHLKGVKPMPARPRTDGGAPKRGTRPEAPVDAAAGAQRRGRGASRSGERRKPRDAEQ